MAENTVLTEAVKATILDAIKLKVASVRRFVNQHPDGSPMAKAGYDTLAELERVITLVAKL